MLIAQDKFYKAEIIYITEGSKTYRYSYKYNLKLSFHIGKHVVKN